PGRGKYDGQELRVGKTCFWGYIGVGLGWRDELFIMSWYSSSAIAIVLILGRRIYPSRGYDGTGIPLTLNNSSRQPKSNAKNSLRHITHIALCYLCTTPNTWSQ
ncbi:Hypothetical protein FKW44_021150, partial [Caligus rogercresseyi]